MGLLWFTALAACAIVPAWHVGRCIGPVASLRDAGLRSFVIASALVVAAMLTTGAIARLHSIGVLAFEATFAVGMLAWRRRRTPTRSIVHVDEWPALVVGTAATLVAFSLAFAAVSAPLTLYDSLSYHLHFAARWVQDGLVQIIPTPFSDEAQAYAPGNGELWLAWLMLPFHSDVLARMGQWPFGLTGALAVYALARRLGAARDHAIYPALFFLLSRPVAEQMVGANVDLVCAAFFLTAVYFAICAVDTNSRVDWGLFGVAAGLYAGTKYLALVYMPVLVGLAFARGWRSRVLWTLPGVAAFALPWYLRNWIVAGSPIYPVTASIAGVTIGRGAFTRAAMLNTIFHTTDLRLTG